MYTLKTLVAVGVICYFIGFLVCLAIFNHICNDCLKSTFERERATEKMYTDAFERLSGLYEYHPQGKNGEVDRGHAAASRWIYPSGMDASDVLSQRRT